MDLQNRGKWSRWKRSEGVSSCTQSESDRAHCRGPAQVLPSIYLQPPQSTSYPTSAQACVCVCMWDASYTPSKTRGHTGTCLLTNGSDLTHQDSSGGVSSSALAATPLPLRSTAAQQKGRQGKVGQADLCARHVKRSEWVKRTGHVRALLLTHGKEEAPCAHGQGPKGANSACWDRHMYAHIPVMTLGMNTSNRGRGRLTLWSNMS